MPNSSWVICECDSHPCACYDPPPRIGPTDRAEAERLRDGLAQTRPAATAWLVDYLEQHGDELAETLRRPTEDLIREALEARGAPAFQKETMTGPKLLTDDECQVLAMFHVLNGKFGPEPVMMAVALLNPLPSWPRRLAVLLPFNRWNARCYELAAAARSLAEAGLIRKVRRERRRPWQRAWDVYDVTDTGREALKAS